MKRLHIHKAQPCGGVAPESLTVVIEEEFPNFDGPTWQRAAAALHQASAAVLAKMLAERLPGGTLDRLVAELLKLKASQLVVSYAIPLPEEEKA